MNKLTKLLSVFVIAGAIGTGIAGVAGCNNGGNGGGGGGHTHDYEYTVSTTDSSKHVVHCKNPGHEGGDTLEDHVDADQNNKCDKCDATIADLGVTSVTITTEPATIKVDDTVELTANVVTSKDGVSKDVTWNIVTGKNYATIEGNVLTATAVGTVYVEAVSVADPSVKSAEPVAIKIEERSIYDDLAGDTANNIIAENFEDASKFTDGQTVGNLPIYGGYSANTQPGVFVWGDGKDMTKAGHITVSNGAATHVTDQENISMVADLTDKVKDYVEGYVELKLSAIGSKHSVLALKGTTTGGDTNISDVVAIYITTSAGDVGVRLGSQDVSEVKAVEGIKLAAETKYKVHFKLDMVSGLITIDITPDGGSKVNLCTELQTNIATLRTVAFVSSGSGARVTTVDNLAINSKELALEEVKASLEKKVDAYVAAATVDVADEDGDTLTLAGENVTTAVSGIKASINAATTAAEAKAVAFTSIDEAILLNAKASAKAFIDNMRDGEPFTGEAASELENAKNIQKTAIEDATDLAGVKAAFLAGKKAVNAVENDEARVTADVTLTFTLTGDDSIGGTLTKKDGANVTLDEIREAVTGVAANKIVTGIKVGGESVALPYTLVAVDSNDDGKKDATNISVEVVLSDYAKLVATENCGVPGTATGADIANLGTDGFFTLTGVGKSETEPTKYQQGKLQQVGAVGKDTYTHQIGLTSGKVGPYLDGKIGNSIMFTVEKACKVTVVCANAAGKTAALSILDGTGAAVTATNIKKDGAAAESFEAAPTDALVTYEFELAAGTYHIGGSGGGLLVFEIGVIY